MFCRDRLGTVRHSRTVLYASLRAPKPWFSWGLVRTESLVFCRDRVGTVRHSRTVCRDRRDRCTELKSYTPLQRSLRSLQTVREWRTVPTRSLQNARDSVLASPHENQGFGAVRDASRTVREWCTVPKRSLQNIRDSTHPRILTSPHENQGFRAPRDAYRFVCELNTPSPGGC